MNIINKIRKEKKMSLQILSDRTGLSIPTLNRYEKKDDISSIPINNLDKVAEGLGVNRAILLGEDPKLSQIVDNSNIDKKTKDLLNVKKFFHNEKDYENTLKRLSEIENRIDEIYDTIVSLNDDGIDQIKTFTDFLKHDKRFYDKEFNKNHHQYRKMIDDAYKKVLNSLKKNIDSLNDSQSKK